MDVVETISKLERTDPGTARLLAEIVTYEALCDEVDRVRPFAEREAAQIIAKRVEGSLETLAKRYAVATTDDERAELAALADALSGVISKKDGDNPATPYWDARGEDGKFIRAGGVREGLLNMLGLASKPRESEIATRSKEVADGLTGSRYDKMRTLGQGLIATGNKEAAAAGTIARIMGDVGPEAERVFGNALRRTAYRYRGTERRPSEDLQRTSSTMARQRRTQGERGTPDARAMAATAAAGAQYLYPQLPDTDLARLSLEAGKLPPSLGVIFDRDGNVVSEAQGFNGDHYLPFDLKNLKRLQGGQYVRTRTTGGPTDEDIYTGLLTGARRLDVVSNSGVFTLEFDPSLRGGRRFNDKARQMVDRYAKIIEAVNTETVRQNGLPPGERARIKRAAFEQYKDSPALAARKFADDVAAAEYQATFLERTEEELQDQARINVEEELKGKQSSGADFAIRQKAEFNRLRQEDQERVIRVYRLDGKGYEAAMKALKQEFPYFIRQASYTPLREWSVANSAVKPGAPLPKSPGRDIGYTERGGVKQGLGVGASRASSQTPTVRTAAAGAETRGATGGEGGSDSTRLTFKQKLAEPGGRASTKTAQEIAGMVQLYGEMETNGEGYEYLAGVPKDEAGNQDAQNWLAWAARNHENATKLGQFLTNPETDESHLRTAVKAAKVLKKELASLQGTTIEPEQLDRSIARLELLLAARNPWADDAPDPVTADPRGAQAPQRFKEIEESASRDALLAYAKTEPDVAKVAQAYRGRPEEEVIAEIGQQAERAQKLLNWEFEGDKPRLDAIPDGLGEDDADDAWALRVGDKRQVPFYKQLEVMQRGYALARMANLVQGIDGVEVPDLTADAGPKAWRGGKGLGPRRLQVHGPQSELSKRLAQVLARS